MQGIFFDPSCLKTKRPIQWQGNRHCRILQGAGKKISVIHGVPAESLGKARPPLGLGLSHRARAFVKLAEICLEPR